MSILSESINDIKFNRNHRDRVMAAQKKMDASTPRAGDMAPDFTLYDIEGKEITPPQLAAGYDKDFSPAERGKPRGIRPALD